MMKITTTHDSFGNHLEMEYTVKSTAFSGLINTTNALCMRALTAFSLSAFVWFIFAKTCKYWHVGSHIVLSWWIAAKLQCRVHEDGSTLALPFLLTYVKKYLPGERMLGLFSIVTCEIHSSWWI